MTLMIIAPEMKIDAWVSKIKALAPRLQIAVWPDIQDPDEIEFALAWNHPHGAFSRYRNLKCIASMGAGVDRLLRDGAVPPGIPITRVVDASMAQSMSEYIVMSVLNHCRHSDLYRNERREKVWRPRIPRLVEKTTIGILGLGQLGRDAAEKLVHLGFRVRGWRRTPTETAGIDTYFGDAALDDFLSETHVLICTLPLTPATENIMDRRLFEKLPQGAYVINVARGEHLVEEDLKTMLESGHLSGACLDVFREEPLPADHPFWEQTEIVITPHIASLTNPKAVVPQIVENYFRMKSGRPLLHLVDRDRGY